MTGIAPSPPVREPSPPAPVVAAVDVVKTYGRGDAVVHALRGVNIGFARGGFTAIMGPSGSGKSTLMHCLAGLDTVTSGSVLLGGADLTRLDDRKLTLMRRERIGFIFQSFNLVPTLTARQNILFPLELAGRTPETPWFDRIVDVLGLRERLDHRPSELSGGQQQRVACARALLARPEVIFADEPTGNLDSVTGREVLELLRRSVRDLGQTIVMVTHDPVAAAFADRVVFLRDGLIVDEQLRPTPDGVLDRLKRLDNE